MTETPRSRRFPCITSGTATTAGGDVRDVRDVRAWPSAPRVRRRSRSGGRRSSGWSTGRRPQRGSFGHTNRTAQVCAWSARARAIHATCPGRARRTRWRRTPSFCALSKIALVEAITGRCGDEAPAQTALSAPPPEPARAARRTRRRPCSHILPRERWRGGRHYQAVSSGGRYAFEVDELQTLKTARFDTWVAEREAAKGLREGHHRQGQRRRRRRDRHRKGEVRTSTPDARSSVTLWCQIAYSGSDCAGGAIIGGDFRSAGLIEVLGVCWPGGGRRRRQSPG